eukprot:649194-Pleurochrysis_carterae.AAC.1
MYRLASGVACETPATAVVRIVVRVRQLTSGLATWRPLARAAARWLRHGKEWGLIPKESGLTMAKLGRARYSSFRMASWGLLSIGSAVALFTLVAYVLPLSVSRCGLLKEQYRDAAAMKMSGPAVQIQRRTASPAREAPGLELPTQARELDTRCPNVVSLGSEEFWILKRTISWLVSPPTLRTCNSLNLVRSVPWSLNSTAH